MRKNYEDRMRASLIALRNEVEELGHRAERAEAGIELEYYTLLEELRLALQSAERKFELLIDSREDQWEDIKTEFEQLWRATRELIRAVTSP